MREDGKGGLGDWAWRTSVPALVQRRKGWRPPSMIMRSSPKSKRRRPSASTMCAWLRASFSGEVWVFSWGRVPSAEGAAEEEEAAFAARAEGAANGSTVAAAMAVWRKWRRVGGMAG